MFPLIYLKQKALYLNSKYLLFKFYFYFLESDKSASSNEFDQNRSPEELNGLLKLF